MDRRQSEPAEVRDAAGLLGAHGVSFDALQMYVRLAAGKELAVPLTRWPRLLVASPAHRQQWILLNHGQRIAWPTLELEVTLLEVRAALHPPGS